MEPDLIRVERAASHLGRVVQSTLAAATGAAADQIGVGGAAGVGVLHGDVYRQAAARPH